jgi:hypothetical protein
MAIANHASRCLSSRRLRLPIQTKRLTTVASGQNYRRCSVSFALTCIAFPLHQDWKVAQGVSARASSTGTAFLEDVSSSKSAAFTLGLLRTANSHHVQATQNDSRNLMNITTGITHRQQQFDASHCQSGYIGQYFSECHSAELIDEDSGFCRGRNDPDSSPISPARNDNPKL